jgi:hypothetical protein
MCEDREIIEAIPANLFAGVCFTYTKLPKFDHDQAVGLVCHSAGPFIQSVPINGALAVTGL